MKNAKLFLIVITFIPAWGWLSAADAQKKLPPCGLNSSALFCDRQTVPKKPEVPKRMDGWPKQYQYICPEKYPVMKGRCTILNFEQGNSSSSRYTCMLGRNRDNANAFVPKGRVHDALACQSAQNGDTKRMYQEAVKAYDAILDRQGAKPAVQYMEWRSSFGFFDFLIKQQEVETQRL